MTQKIVIEQTGIRGERGQRYRVHFEGAVLIEDTWNPEYDACRALLARGITGKLETWRRGGACPCMRLDIERAAGLTIEESVTVGPRLSKWHPWDGTEEGGGNGGSRVDDMAKDGQEQFSGTLARKNKTPAHAKFRKPMQPIGAGS